MSAEGFFIDGAPFCFGARPMVQSTLGPGKKLSDEAEKRVAAQSDDLRTGKALTAPYLILVSPTFQVQR